MEGKKERDDDEGDAYVVVSGDDVVGVEVVVEKKAEEAEEAEKDVEDGVVVVVAGDEDVVGVGNVDDDGEKDDVVAIDVVE